jgi:hypothetical protein
MEGKKALLRQTAGRAVVRPVMSTNIYVKGQVVHESLSPCGRSSHIKQCKRPSSTTRRIALEAMPSHRLPFVMPSKVENPILKHKGKHDRIIEEA